MHVSFRTRLTLFFLLLVVLPVIALAVVAIGVERANSDNEIDFRTENTLISGGIYYQATKSLKAVGEFNYEWTKGRDATAGEKNTRFTPGVGMMLFF